MRNPPFRRSDKRKEQGRGIGVCPSLSADIYRTTRFLAEFDPSALSSKHERILQSKGCASSALEKSTFPTLSQHRVASVIAQTYRSEHLLEIVSRRHQSYARIHVSRRCLSESLGSKRGSRTYQCFNEISKVSFYGI